VLRDRAEDFGLDRLVDLLDLVHAEALAKGRSPQALWDERARNDPTAPSWARIYTNK
jgi:hypothetical protein